MGSTISCIRNGKNREGKKRGWKEVFADGIKRGTQWKNRPSVEKKKERMKRWNRWLRHNSRLHRCFLSFPEKLKDRNENYLENSRFVGAVSAAKLRRYTIFYTESDSRCTLWFTHPPLILRPFNSCIHCRNSFSIRSSSCTLRYTDLARVIIINLIIIYSPSTLTTQSIFHSVCVKCTCVFVSSHFPYKSSQ